MKNLHIPTILVTLGLVGLVAILSGQNMVAAPSVQISNPLGVPGWVPSGVWMARYGWDPIAGKNSWQDYTVPAGHFALVESGCYASGVIRVLVDDGSGFYTLTESGSDLNVLPGILVDEGTIIRADSQGKAISSVHGYVIPK